MDVTPSDRDAIIRTVIGEAADEPLEGQAGVAHVILNRLNSGKWGNNARNVVLAPGEFEPWQTRRRELLGISPKSDQYQQTGQIVDRVLSGDIPDPTGGADHFLNPAIVRARRGGSLPDWAQGQPSAVIGRHSFYMEPEDLLGSWGAQKTAPAAAPGTPEEDLLGTWLTKPAQTTPEISPAVTAITIPRKAQPGEKVPEKKQPEDETAGQYVARQLAAHQDTGLGEMAVRGGLGMLRGVGDVADTLATAITGAGRHGASTLASAGVIAPETAATVGNWADRVQAAIAAENTAFERAAANSPMAQGGRVFGQAAGTGPFVAGAAPALAAMGAAPVVGLPLAGAAIGAGTSALTSSASDQPLSEQIATGGLVGGLLGPAGRTASAGFSGLRRLAFGAIDPETAALADKARNVFNIPVTAGQISSAPSTRFLDSVLQRLPFSGYGARTAEQQSALNRAVASTFGEDADKITMQTIRSAKQRIGDAFNDVANRTGPISVDQTFLGDMHQIEMHARSVLPESEIKPLKNQLKDIATAVDYPTGTISPESYQTLTRKDAPLSRMQQSKDPNIRFYANKVRDALDDVMQRSAPADVVGDLRNARSQWKALKTVEPLAKKATTGDISPALLLGKVNTSYAGGGGDLGEIGRIGQRFLKEPPSSGTSERLMSMYGLKTALGAAGLGGEYAFDPENFQRNAALTLLALAGGRGASSLLRSNILARSMINSGLGRPGVSEPATQFIGRYTPAAGALTTRLLRDISARPGALSEPFGQ